MLSCKRLFSRHYRNSAYIPMLEYAMIVSIMPPGKSLTGVLLVINMFYKYSSFLCVYVWVCVRARACAREMCLKVLPTGLFLMVFSNALPHRFFININPL